MGDVKIGVLTGADENQKNLLDITLPILKQYCLYRDYDLHYFTENVGGVAQVDGKSYFARYPFIKKHLPNYDWVFWELATFLKFLKNNNSTAIDWVLSDTSYSNSSELIQIRDTFLKVCNIDYYLFHHYSLLKSMYEKYVNPKRKTKQFITDRKIQATIKQVQLDVDFIKQSNNR